MHRNTKGQLRCNQEANLFDRKLGTLEKGDIGATEADVFRMEAIA